MNLNKCTRCGCFFAMPQDVCPNCAVKDNYEKAKLQEFIDEHGVPTSIEGLCDSTHISLKNLYRFLDQEQFAPLHHLQNEI